MIWPLQGSWYWQCLLSACGAPMRKRCSGAGPPSLPWPPRVEPSSPPFPSLSLFFLSLPHSVSLFLPHIHHLSPSLLYQVICSFTKHSWGFAVSFQTEKFVSWMRPTRLVSLWLCRSRLHELMLGSCPPWTPISSSRTGAQGLGVRRKACCLVRHWGCYFGGETRHPVWRWGLSWELLEGPPRPL